MRIVPENHRRVYLDWMESIRPWCISRQLWWGHRLPVYYCEPCGHVHVAAVAPERCEVCGGEPRQEEDVLDTWFSSALWPFATLGWPEQTPQLRAFYPTAVLSTARDILFLWVARMIMMGLRFTGEAPFAEVYIHSVIQAPDGRRMSKSLGTGIDPLDEIARHGADAVRFGLLAMSSSQDVRYSAEKVRQGQALANKLFNAARFALLRIAGMDRDPTHPGGPSRIEPAPAARARSRTAGSSRACSRSRPTRRRESPTTTSRTPRSGCTTSSTGSCATGTWRSSSRALQATRREGATRTVRRSPRRCCMCCARRLRSPTR